MNTKEKKKYKPKEQISKEDYSKKNYLHSK